MRRRLEREAPETLVVRMWAFPVLSYVTIAAMGAVIIAMAFLEGTRSQLFISLLTVGVVLAAYELRERRRRRVFAREVEEIEEPPEGWAEAGVGAPH